MPFHRFHTGAAWGTWIIWTTLVLYLMLSPSEGTTVTNISGLFGGTEITDAIGHSIIFCIETTLTYALFRRYLSVSNSLYGATIIILCLGGILETAQFWVPSRGVSILDYSANVLGVGVFWVLWRYWSRR